MIFYNRLRCHLTPGAAHTPRPPFSKMATIELKVKTLDSRVLALQVQGAQTILDVKRLVFTETLVPVEQQRLIFRGKVLKDALAIPDCLMVEARYTWFKGKDTPPLIQISLVVDHLRNRSLKILLQIKIDSSHHICRFHSNPEESDRLFHSI